MAMAHGAAMNVEVYPVPRKPHSSPSHLRSTQCPGLVLPPPNPRLKAGPSLWGRLALFPKPRGVAPNHGDKHLHPVLSPTHTHPEHTHKGVDESACGDGMHPYADRGSLPQGNRLGLNPATILPPPNAAAHRLSTLPLKETSCEPHTKPFADRRAQAWPERRPRTESTGNAIRIPCWLVVHPATHLSPHPPTCIAKVSRAASGFCLLSHLHCPFDQLQARGQVPFHTSASRQPVCSPARFKTPASLKANDRPTGFEGGPGAGTQQVSHRDWSLA
ncbi:uncharacterized protein LOC116658818 [Camelus ferus]|uniref:Uncharacterized protein LOC116658818 n=1 Tax=Camelus ferus TaxID=419612 RepID=A0A8B8RSH5_CAMFR|nr:uncharacterized protein LOC116658818 [Camelus ferus]